MQLQRLLAGARPIDRARPHSANPPRPEAAPAIWIGRSTPQPGVSQVRTIRSGPRIPWGKPRPAGLAPAGDADRVAPEAEPDAVAAFDEDPDAVFAGREVGAAHEAAEAEAPDGGDPFGVEERDEVGRCDQ